MKFSTVFSALVAILSVPASATNLVERDGFGVYLCTAPGFGGSCFHNSNLPAGACYNWVFPGGQYVNAIGPDQGMLCMIFDSKNCGGARYALLYPGNSNLGSVGWANRMQSFYCVNLAQATLRFVTPEGAYDNITVTDTFDVPFENAAPPPPGAEITQ